MAINPVKKSLFTADTVFTRPLVKRSPLMARLDTRVNDLALQIIGITALSIAAGGAIAATISMGWTLIPIVVVVSLVVLGSTSLYIRSHFRRYHNPYLLSKYQEQAMHLSRKLRYLDCTDFLQGRADEEKTKIKQSLLRPLRILIGQHSSLETILRHRILPPAELKRAFDLEIKYLELPEAFTLYAQIREAARAVPDYDISVFTSPEALQEWKQKLNGYLVEQGNVIALKDIIKPIDPLEKPINILNNVAQLMQQCFKYGILTQEKDDFNKLHPFCQKHQKEYQAFVLKQCPEIAEKRKLESLRKDYYESHSVHEMIFKEQQHILKGIEDIQAEQEQRITALKSQYHQTFVAIKSRKPRDEGERTDDATQLKFFTDQMNTEEAAIVKEHEDKLDRYMEKGISADFVEMLTTLQTHKISLDRTYNDAFSTNLETPINAFVRSYSTREIARYKQLFEGCFLSFQLIANA